MEIQKYEVKDMTGTLWMEVQTKDGKEGPYQVRTGTAKIFGKEMYVNAYEKTTSSGKTLLALTFKLKQPKEPLNPADAANLIKEIHF